MKIKVKSEKEQISHALDIAYEKVLAEQDVYRDRIEAVIEVSDDKVNAKLVELGGAGILEIMKDERHPPSSQERQDILNQSWEEIPSRIRIDTIEDKDIGCQTYFLNEVAEHRDRIKAIAVFCEALCINRDNKHAGLVFRFWTQYSVYHLLAEEQKGVSEEVHKLMCEMAQAMKEVIDIFARSGGIKVEQN